MTRTTADILREARALIDTPEKWIKGEYGRDGCFCAAASIDHVSQINPSTYDIKALVALYRNTPKPFEYELVAYNDHPDTTHADIMALFDRAISEAER
jgi:hypothetical protein